MKPEIKAISLVSLFRDQVSGDPFFPLNDDDIKCAAKICAEICVNEILASNPHSNPLNTEPHSTMEYWVEVKKEIKRL